LAQHFREYLLQNDKDYEPRRSAGYCLGFLPGIIPPSKSLATPSKFAFLIFKNFLYPNFKSKSFKKANLSAQKS
jgi:hypothetical protein